VHSIDCNVDSYRVGVKSFNRKYETTDERMIDNDVAKPLIILSAYLITAAIIKPPRALIDEYGGYDIRIRKISLEEQ
jgi:hypothetical protein